MDHSSLLKYNNILLYYNNNLYGQVEVSIEGDYKPQRNTRQGAQPRLRALEGEVDKVWSGRDRPVR